MERPLAVFEQESGWFILLVFGSLSISAGCFLYYLYHKDLVLSYLLGLFTVILWITLFKGIRPLCVTQRITLYKDRLLIEISQNITVPLTSISKIKVIASYEHSNEYEIFYETGSTRLFGAEGAEPLLKELCRLTNLKIVGLEPF
ncbi:MAG: hypothetical protein KF836_06685 [Fimbriimonadaceae bacterium]|nr:hypothetical protein [Fimbriimonadaceae bacterium]